METWLWSSELNTVDFLMPQDLRVRDIVEQNNMLFKRSAAVLDEALATANYLVEDRFTVTDIIVGYTVNWGDTDGLLGEFANLQAYLDRLFEREHCTFRRPT